MSAAPETQPRPEEHTWEEPPEPPPPAPASPAQQHRSEPAPTEQPDRGTPAGQLAVGLACVLTLLGAGLYQLLGVWGLAGGAGSAVAAGGGYGYWRWRRAHPRRDRTRRAREPRPRAAHRSDGRNTFGGSTSRSGRRAVFSSESRKKPGGRTSARMPSFGDPRRPGGRTDRKRMTFPGGRPDSKRPASDRRRRAPGESRRGAPEAARGAGHRLASAGRTIRRRTASPRLDAHAAHLAHRVGDSMRGTRRRLARAGQTLRRRTATPGLDQRVAEAARRAGRWIDRRTGQRASTAWAAALTGGRTAAVTALRKRYRRWDAEATAALVSGWAWLTRRWRRSEPVTETAANPDTPPEPKKENPQPAPRPEPACPHQPGHRPHPARQGAPMGFALVTHATELPTIAAGYHTDDMMEVKGHLEIIRELPIAAATSIRVLMERLAADYPLHPEVIEALQRLYEALSVAANPADEVAVTFSTMHADDINRRLQPRTNERLWNV